MANRKIRRSTCAAVCDWWEKNGPPAVMNKPAEPDPRSTSSLGFVFFGVNVDSFFVIPAGSVVRIRGFYPTTISYQYARRRILNGKIKLSVSPPFVQDPTPAKFALTALTPAKPHHICRAKCPSGDIFFGNVYYPVYYDPADVNHENPIWDHAYKYVTQYGVATDDLDEAFAEIGFESSYAPYDAGGQVAIAICKTLTPLTDEQKKAIEDAAVQDVAGKLTSTRAATIASVTTQGTTIPVPTSGTVAITATGSMTLALSDNESQGSIPVVTDITSSGGALAVETKYLNGSFSGTETTANVAFSTQNFNAVGSVATTTADRVAEVTIAQS